MVAQRTGLQPRRRWPGLAASLLAMVASGLVVLWVVAPLLYSGGGVNPDAQAAATATTRTGILAVFAATIAALGAAAALAETRRANHDANQRFRDAQDAEFTRFREAQDAQLARFHAEQEAQLTRFREEQAADRYARAVGQLGEAGEGRLVARLGGIYALRRIAEDFPREQRTIVQVLCAFIRQHEPPPLNDDTGDRARRPPVDVQAALSVIARRDRSHDTVESVQYTDEDEYDRLVDLSGAHLEGAELVGAFMQQADLRGVHLQDAELFEIHLEGADLRGAHLERAHITGGRLTGANLRDAHLDHLTIAFSASLENADLTGATLENANLQGAILRSATLSGTNLTHADLSGTDLVNAKLAESHTPPQDRAGWLTIEPAVIVGANLRNADLRGSNLRGVDLATTLGLVQRQLDQAAGDEATVLPPHLSKPPSWGVSSVRG